MNKKETYLKAMLEAVKISTKIGQDGITKHDILVMSQKVDSSIKDGECFGRLIGDLVKMAILVKTGKKGNANTYKRIQHI